MYNFTHLISICGLVHNIGLLRTNEVIHSSRYLTIYYYNIVQSPDLNFKATRLLNRLNNSIRILGYNFKTVFITYSYSTGELEQY